MLNQLFKLDLVNIDTFIIMQRCTLAFADLYHVNIFSVSIHRGIYQIHLNFVHCIFYLSIVI